MASGVVLPSVVSLISRRQSRTSSLHQGKAETNLEPIPSLITFDSLDGYGPDSNHRAQSRNPEGAATIRLKAVEQELLAKERSLADKEQSLREKRHELEAREATLNARFRR
jgi:hypothetical protein